MSGESRRISSLLCGHLAAGIVVGTLFGLAYFALEPLKEYSGRYELLGAPLSRILGVYLLFGLSAGLIAGLAGAAAGAALGRGRGAGGFVPAYAAFFAALLFFMHGVRNYSRFRFEHVAVSRDGVKFLAVFAVLLAAGILLSRVLERRRVFGGVAPRAGWIAVAFCAALVLGVQGYASYRENRVPALAAGSEPSGPNVVFVLLDALRADHVSAYGYPRQTTPVIDSLAREGVLFRNARSHGNRTIISVPSIFTSLYPSFHGTVGRGDKVRALGDEYTTIAETFRSAGYATVGLMSNVYLKTGYGLGQGFDTVERFYAERYLLGLYKLLRHVGVVERPRYAVALHPDAEEVTESGLRRLRNLEGKPFFLYAHYMDTHHPYTPPPPYDTMFGEDDPGPGPQDLFRKTTRWLKGSASDSLSTREIEKLKDYYDGSIRRADEQIGRLVDAARKASGKRDLVVVVTSDHGDEFLEKGRFHHENLLIEELIRVPLVFWSSGGLARGTEVRTLVRHVDLLPTLADLIGAETPAGIAGRSLASMLRGGTDTAEVESFAEGDYCASLNRGDWKMMLVDSTGTFRLYNLSSDPGEKKDLAGTAGDVYIEMRTRLAQYMAEAKAAREAAGAAETQADEETVRKLRALGYM
ncbi:MAG: sulfatase [Candidatus Krumholzibacteriota bacterium]|nr:sulfatase [Candidatus Krumholzibacteriota bacterium]